MKYIVISIYVIAIALQIFSIYYAFGLLRSVKNYAYAIFFMPLALLVILIDRFYYLIDCCLIGNYKPSQALIYLLISIFILIGISGLKKLFNVLEEQNEKLEKISKVDHLTGVFNRLEIESRITQEIKRSQRTNDPIAFLLLDIDHFKNINDTYGHPVGDKVLKSLTKFCVSELRVIDVLGRVGGEEFLIMLPNTDESEAYRVAERIRSGVAELICDQVNHEPVHIQVSIGISIYDPAEEFNNLLGEAPHQTMKKYSRRADLAMYQAKQAGRNQTKCWRE